MILRTACSSLLLLMMLPLGGAAAAEDPAPADGPKTLGALGSDLVYTPITACRIVDTQATGAGAIAAGGTRSFSGIGEASYAAQGGSATNCGTLGVAATALMLHVTAVTPTLAGTATVYPFNTTRPGSPSLQYSAGAVVNGAVLAQIPNPPQASDFTIHTSATANYTVDIVGYFAPPRATALDCTETFASQAVGANASFDIDLPNCPAGYSITGAGCRTPGFSDATFAINGLFRPAPGTMDAFCSGRNITAGSITVEGTVRCCRVPGR